MLGLKKRERGLAAAAAAVALAAVLAAGADARVGPITGRFLVAPAGTFDAPAGHIGPGRPRPPYVLIDAHGYRLDVSILWFGKRSLGQCVYANGHRKTIPAADWLLGPPIPLKADGTFAVTRRDPNYNLGGDAQWDKLSGHVIAGGTAIAGTVRRYLYYSAHGRTGGLFPETCRLTFSFVAKKYVPPSARKPPSPPPSPPPPALPHAYDGKTAQGYDISLTVAPDAVTFIDANVDLSCTDGETLPGQVVIPRAPITGARFSADTSDAGETMHIDGQIAGSAITGTVRDVVQQGDATCDSGPVAFTAHRT